MQIKNKQEMYEHMKAGRFGNINPHWFTFDAISQTSYRGLVGIRSLIPGGRCVYNVPYGCIRKYLAGWKGGYNISPMIPSENLLIQGEVWRSVDGLYLMYSQVKSPMRVALEVETLHAERSKAVAILRHYMDVDSYENLERLLDEYEDAVVEFSTFTKLVGTLKLNTVIWEVRNY